MLVTFLFIHKVFTTCSPICKLSNTCHTITAYPNNLQACPLDMQKQAMYVGMRNPQINIWCCIEMLESTTFPMRFLRRRTTYMSNKITSVSPLQTTVIEFCITVQLGTYWSLVFFLDMESVKSENFISPLSKVEFVSL